MEHELKRILKKWGSCGRYHDEPIVFRAIKDISDSHLLHIIPWIKEYPEAYPDSDTLKMMEDEQTYRTKHYIFVEDYKN